MTEKEWQQRVTDYATLRGWRWAHFRPAQTQRGNWVTPMSGWPGFPDLTLIRNGELVFAELKSDVGRVQPNQQRWFDDLTAVSEMSGKPRAVKVYVWKPKDWPEVEKLLR